MAIVYLELRHSELILSRLAFGRAALSRMASAVAFHSKPPGHVVVVFDVVSNRPDQFGAVKCMRFGG